MTPAFSSELSAGPIPTAIPFSFPGLPGVRCLFGTAAAGDMALSNEKDGRDAPIANRIRFMQRAGFARWAEMHQVHGDALATASGSSVPDGAGLPRADGLFTMEPGMGLVVKTADCQPLLLARDDGRAVAALHVGWRGNASHFPATAVERLCRIFACAPSRLMAVRGPSLGPEAEFVNFHREWPSEFSPWHNSATNGVALWELTRSQLEAAGLRPERIHAVDRDTLTGGRWFFSHRRGDAGRQVSAIWIE